MDNKIFKKSDLEEFKLLIDRSQRIVLTCHVRPDGDAMGSTMGLAAVLRLLNKEAVVVTPDQAPQSLWFLPGYSKVVAATKYPEFAEKLLNEADLVICCDFNHPSRQDKLADPVQATTCPKILIDHHEKPSYFANVTFSFPKMSSTCELVFRLVAACGWYQIMSKDAAVCLCTGLITDTRNFAVNSDNPEVYEILLKLIEKGVDKRKIIKEALSTKSYNSVKLQAFAVAERMEVFKDHHAAVITLSLDDLDRFDYQRGDSEGLVNAPLEIRGVVYSFFLREEKNMVKVSARSEGGFPVNEICSRFFSGGGHIMAAGGEFRDGDDETRLQRCRQILIDAMPEYDDEVKKLAPPAI